jgi:aryl-alcohol dehydrogenase-like predicted oxidoreductase
MERRSFLHTATGAVGAGALNAGSLSGSNAESPDAVNIDQEIARRMLGRTGASISIVGYPGFALQHEDQKACSASLRRAFDRGINYFDVAPAYAKGLCERRMGIGLKGVPRDQYFLSCKTKMRDKKGAREELDRSLKRLKTDHFDLYQLHCLIHPQEVTEALGPGGAMETILEARKQGKIKHIGFSAHTTRAAMHALRNFRFDTVMFPINFVEYYTIGYGKAVLAEAKAQGAGVLAIKAMAYGRWPEGAERTRKWWYRPLETPDMVNLGLRFTLSQEPVVSAIPPAWLDLADRAIEEIKTYRQATAKDLDRCRQLAAGCQSVFQEVEQSTTNQLSRSGPHAPDNPHEFPPCMLA